MKEWIFKVFIHYDAAGKPINEINNWLNSLDSRMRARVRSIIAHLETQKDMRCRWFESYNSHQYIYEIRFRKHKKYYRLFGCFGPEGKDFTLLIPVDKVAGRLKPTNGIELAEERRKLIFQDRRYLDDFV